MEVLLAYLLRSTRSSRGLNFIKRLLLKKQHMTPIKLREILQSTIRSKLQNLVGSSRKNGTMKSIIHEKMRSFPEGQRRLTWNMGTVFEP